MLMRENQRFGASSVLAQRLPSISYTRVKDINGPSQHDLNHIDSRCPELCSGIRETRRCSDQDEESIEIRQDSSIPVALCPLGKARKGQGHWYDREENEAAGA